MIKKLRIHNFKSWKFVPSDRKWIALYVTHGSTTPIHNATDSDWEKARDDLTAHNIKVHQLCTGNHI